MENRLAALGFVSRFRPAEIGVELIRGRHSLTHGRRVLAAWIRALTKRINRSTCSNWPNSSRSSADRLPSFDFSRGDRPSIDNLGAVEQTREQRRPGGFRLAFLEETGNVRHGHQWTETVVGPGRVFRGGAFSSDSGSLHAQAANNIILPTGEEYYLGFRVASSAAVPEPGSIALLLAGAVALGTWRLRRNA